MTKNYSVSVELTFSIEAPDDEKAAERAEQVKESITVGKTAKWLGDIEFGEPEVEEA